ncbi:type I restriction endonuclease subunit R [Glutamicibacter arilaitensis]|uniref:type I restriction endonuclease subunit R n=1 Tax=Glutamicibacter arilaitensis TaxID=256701 RepID=UPI003FD555FF
MNDGQLMESFFEAELCQDLSQRGWLYEHEGNANKNGWDPSLALIPSDVLQWLEMQYPQEFAKAIPEDLTSGQRLTAQEKLLKRLIQELGKTTRMSAKTGDPMGGLLGVLRRGFDYAQTGRQAANFGPLAAFPPENPHVISAAERADAVRLRILRQVRFDTTSNATIDLVLCINGLPIVTMELKTDNTQSINHAVKQYKRDRVPSANRPLLAPGRALVHFAVSNDLVFMATKLAGETTTFLPFNQGNEGHEGNPPSTTGSATDYLWNQILDRPLFLRILKSYAIFEPNRSKKNDGRLIFPRFHQLRAVERIVADIESQGPGGRYLVQHSAGSGKTKTIAWAAHRLIRHMDADATSTFDSVIVITDRTALDENIRDDMALVQSSNGLVVNVGERSGAKSPQLIEALAEGGHIIVTTLQTFPALAKTLSERTELHGRRWAVIADEAHSSQSGDSSKALKKMLVDVDLNGDEDISAEDLLTATDAAIASSANITFIALTATPKSKTLRLFGTQVSGEDRWEAFDTYTMAQAIEEGFILDVLTNYSTYNMFVRVREAVESENAEREVEMKRAVFDIARFALLHDTAIAQKVEVAVEHFRTHVSHLLSGEARAMVVTSGRKQAVEWSKKMNAYIAKKGYTNLQTLVAFSQTITDESGVVHSETSMNERPDVAKAFREEDEYKVLIVANKFQTGFDEPRLMAMYVDKKLSGIATVQTLSRLNRMYPGKSAPMVLDFVNDPQLVVKDFQRYYTDAHIDSDVDPNALYTMAQRLDASGMYTEEQVAKVVAAYGTNAGGEAVQRALGPIKETWNRRVRAAKFHSDNTEFDAIKQFRSDVVSYRNAWQFLSQIVDYQDEDLRNLAILATLLARNLHVDPDAYDGSYMDGVQLVGVRVEPKSLATDLALTPGEGSGLPLPLFETEPRGSADKPRGPLGEAITKVNELFAFNGESIDPNTVEGFITAVWGFLTEDEEVAAMAKSNTPEQLRASEGYNAAFMSAVFKAFQGMDQFKGVMANSEMLAAFKDISINGMHSFYQGDEYTDA